MTTPERPAEPTRLSKQTSAVHYKQLSRAGNLLKLVVVFTASTCVVHHSVKACCCAGCSCHHKTHTKRQSVGSLTSCQMSHSVCPTLVRMWFSPLRPHAARTPRAREGHATKFNPISQADGSTSVLPSFPYTTTLQSTTQAGR